MKLYTYFRSSAAYRVRIALALKGLAWEPAYIHLLRGGGEQKSAEYRAINPLGLVPALEEDGPLVQSTAICEYIEEKYPDPALLPKDLAARAYVRAVMATVACEIHPINNLRVLNYVTGTLGHSEAEKIAWYRYWVAAGFEGLEAFLTQAGRTGRYALGDTPTLADAFIVPQVYNARRFECPLDAYPILRRVADAAAEHPAIASARPEVQGDAG
ncbi:MAG: maleylacetoacetate isomerase [Proteobacteria bacterium]|nr:maleylacetoacetate isomerase [Pseudomonadota bacterium]